MAIDHQRDTLTVGIISLKFIKKPHLKILYLTYYNRSSINKYSVIHDHTIY